MRFSSVTGVFAFGLALLQIPAGATPFRFDRDTFAFQNATVLKYKDGVAFFRPKSERDDPANKFTRRCFVMARSAMQFHKFARFDLQGAPLSDEELAARIRAVTRREPWSKTLPESQRILFPGYANLREISKARAKVFQENIGSGFMTYFRPSNIRMVFLQSKGYQEETHRQLNAALARGELFVAFLTTYPKMSINHAVLIYGRKSARPGEDLERYFVYDPNHAEAPRELTWSARERAFAYQKDIDFIGGFVRVYQVYGKAMQ
ncbi:MAG: hypothetical protein IRY93_02430 [Chthoniobacterales bacterium]|nr:hypothetical protein [Chthoniobacterales bacterium]